MASLEKGDSLSYSASKAVKYTQLATSVVAIVMVVLNLLKSKYPILQVVTEDTVNAVVFSVFGIFNAWATVASSDKVGV